MTDAMRAESVTVAGNGGDEIEAYLAQPLAEGAFGAVVVIHHFPGYDEETKEITRRFAHHGYLALCPNLYSREAPGAGPEEAAAPAPPRSRELRAAPFRGMTAVLPAPCETPP